MADDGGAAAVPGESAGYIPEDTNTLVLYSGMTSSGEKLSKADILQVFSGGTALLTTVNSGGILQLYDGGLTRSTTVNNGGRFYVYSGGTADITKISSGAVNIEGTASNTSVYAGGRLEILTDGTASNTSVYAGGRLEILTDGTASNTTVFSNGQFHVSYGGAANNITVNANASMFIASGGTATGQMNFANKAVVSAYEGSFFDFDISGVSPKNDLFVNNLSLVQGTPSFTLTVSATQAEGKYNLAGGAAGFDKTITVRDTSGATLGTITVAEGTKTLNGQDYTLTLNSSGELAFKLGTLIPDVTGDVNGAVDLTSGIYGSGLNILSGGVLRVLNGGFASMTAINSKGSMFISDGGKADGITANPGCEFYIFSGATATQIKENGGYVIDNGGATVTFVSNSFSGYTYSGRQWATLHSGTTGTDLTAGSDGFIYVIGGVAQIITINSGGILSVSTSGTADNATVNSGGKINIYGGTANSITVNSGGSLEVSSGGTATNVVWTPCAGNVQVLEGAYVTFTSQYSGVYFGSGNQLLSSAMVMESKTLSGGSLGPYMSMYVMSGGTANSTILNSHGNMYVSSGGTANSTTVNDWGWMYVSNGATANGTTLNDWGRMYVFSGATANSTIVNDGGWMYVSSGATANSTTVNPKGRMYVYNGATANSTTIYASGSMYLYSGGTANSTVNNGILFVYSGGTADSTTVNSGGSMSVSSGTAINTTVNSVGGMYVSGGGTANSTTVNSGGVLNVYDGGKADNTTVNASGSMSVSSGGTADSTTVNSGGSMSVSSGGTAINTTVNSIGGMYVSGGGTANNTTVNSDGGIYVSVGGTAINTTVNSGGSMLISSGGTATGKMSFADNAVVSAFNGSIFDFDISGVSPNNDLLVNNLSLVHGMPTCTLTVSGTQADGRYYLAEGAAGFNRTITVKDTSGTTLGTLTVGSGTQAIDGRDYTLTRNGKGALYVRLGALTPDITGDLDSAAELTEDMYASGVNIVSKGMLTVSSGGLASMTTVNPGGRMYVSSGGTANEIIENGGYVNVADGADVVFASNTISGLVLANGSATVHSGTTANATTLNYNSYLFVSGGGTAISTTVNFEGYLFVSGGGTAINATVNSGGSIIVSSGGTANSTTVNSGYLCVSSGGTATDIDWTPCVGSVFFANGAYITFASQHSGVYYGANNSLFSNTMVMESKTVSGYVSMYVMSGGTAIGTMVNDVGVMYVSSGGTAINTTVSFDAFMIVSGGTADTTTVDAGSIIYVVSGGMANSTTVNSGGELAVSNGGMANSTTVNSGGELDVFGGATVNSTTINSSGFLNVEGGATANNTRVSSGGRLYVYAGKANGFTIASGGVLHVYGAGKTTGKMMFETGAIVSAYDGAIVDFDLTHAAAGADALLNDLASVNGAPSFTITVNGLEMPGEYKLADGATGFDKTITVVNTSGTTLGTLTVAGGTKNINGQDYKLTLTGSALSLKVGNPDKTFSGIVTSGETKIISSGSSAFGATVNGSGVLIIENGATAYNTLVNSEGIIFVSSGAKVGNLTLEEDGGALIGTDVVATDVVIHHGVLLFDKGAAFRYSSGNLVQSNFVMSGGRVVIQGGRVEGAIISGGFTSVTSGGRLAEATLVAANVDAYDDTALSGLTATDGTFVRVTSGCDVQRLSINSGSILTGVMRDISDLSFNEGTLELNIMRTAPGNDFLVDANTFSGIDRNDVYNVTLKVHEMPSYNGDTIVGGAPGTYQLIESAGLYGFDKTITVVNAGLEEIGTLTLGKTVEIYSYYYTLNMDANNSLTVTLSKDDPRPEPVLLNKAKGDRDGNGISDVMFVWTGEHGEGNHAHGYWMNGSADWWSANAFGVSPDWDNLGSYDMDGDGGADAVMFGNVIVNNARGAYIGYYQDGNDMDGWVTIGFLDNSENIAWQNKVCNLTGNADGRNSIVWYAPELYALGAWKDGTTEWADISHDFGGTEWKLAGCGDFDGDGRDSVLMTYNNGQLFYTVDIDGGTPQGLGSIDWRGWDLRAIGDFSGDGRDDIVLFHKDTGSMVMCADGNFDDFKSIGQLAANDWFVVGAGDYNGDAKDDLLVRQYSTGMLGYYICADQSQWVEMGRGVGMEWTVIA